MTSIISRFSVAEVLARERYCRLVFEKNRMRIKVLILTSVAYENFGSHVFFSEKTKGYSAINSVMAHLLLRKQG